MNRLSQGRIWSSRIRDYWSRLGDTQNQCEGSDYFPEGGMRTFYCHMLTFLDYKTLRRLAGMPVFVRGPHSHRRLDLDNRYDFGHYNPDFVAWLCDHAVPAATDTAFARLTQGIYDRYVRKLADTYYATYGKLVDQPTFLEREMTDYREQIRNRTLPAGHYEKYFTFAELALGEFDGNVVKTAVSFWIRRSIDGTAPLFFEGLQRLRKAYGADG
jgi:hypothetical protein